MNYFLQLLLLFQSGASYEPILSHNMVPFGPFEVVVPEGIHLAYQEDARQMFKLLGADDIPNCEGVYFSTSATWNYGISIQYFSAAQFVFEPEIESSTLEDVYSRVHLLSLAPVEKQGTVVWPFQYDADGRFVQIGLKYDAPSEGGNHEGHDHEEGEEHEDEGEAEPFVVAKKIWLSPNGAALVMTLRASELGFNMHNEAIHAAFQSLYINTDNDIDPPEVKGTYLQLLQFPRALAIAEALSAQDQDNPPDAAAEEAEIGPDMTLSFGLGALGLAVLAVVFISRRNAGRDSDSAS